jgi:hypothetical protein
MIRSSAVFAVVVSSAPAFAQPTIPRPAPPSAADLVTQGRDLLASGRIAEACTAFDRSWRLDAAVATLLDLADCRERNGQLATAWQLFAEAERRTEGAASEETQQLHDAAHLRVDRLGPRMSRLTIRVAPGTRLDEVELDGRALDAKLWNRRLIVDGGTHTITSRAAGGVPWSTEVTVAAERDVKTIDIASELVPEGRSSLALPVTLGVDGVALGSIALAVELSAEVSYHRAQAEPSSSSIANADYNAANSLRHVAQGLVVGGALFAGAAVWTYVRASRHDGRRPVVMVAPSGLVVAGRF